MGIFGVDGEVSGGFEGPDGADCGYWDELP
jgi:hypothetical protein